MSETYATCRSCGTKGPHVCSGITFNPAQGPDSHHAINYTSECVCITFPVTGWYKIAGHAKEIYFKAGDQLLLNGPYTPLNPTAGTTREGS